MKKTCLNLMILIACMQSHAGPTQELIGLLSQKRTSQNSVNSIADNFGMQMDALQIQQIRPGQFIGIYHVHQGQDRFCVHIATSISQNGPWMRRNDIDCNYASQGTMQVLPDQRILLAYEKNDKGGKPYIRFLFFDSLTDLLSNQPLRKYDQELISGLGAQGTPNFRWIRYNGNPDTMTVEFGFHQHKHGRDFNSIGFLRQFKSIDYYVHHELNEKLNSFAGSHLGDRSFLIYKGRPYTVIEAMTKHKDWLSWRLYLYDELANELFPLDLQTTGGSNSFGNPSLAYFTDTTGQLFLNFNSYIFGPSPNAGQHVYSVAIEEAASAVNEGIAEVYHKTFKANAFSSKVGYRTPESLIAKPNDKGHLAFGPYDRSLPHAPLVATFNLSVIQTSSTKETLVTIEIFDATKKQIIAKRDLSLADFSKIDSLQNLSLPFDWRMRNGHMFEARVFVHGRAEVQFSGVAVSE